MVFEARRERQKLLHETDHQALLVASRQMIRDYPGQRINNAEHDPRVPEIIRELGPTSIEISHDRLVAELFGGFDHYGFVAYAEGAAPVDDPRQLTGGLCYYSE